MRTQLSLLALVVAILASQASAVSVSPLEEYYKAKGKDLNSIEKLSSEEVVSKLNIGDYSAMDVEMLLFAADDKSVKVCNDHTIRELLALNDVSQNECTAEAFGERANYCNQLEDEANKANFACANVQRFCNEVIEVVMIHCEKPVQVELKRKAPMDAQAVLSMLNPYESTEHDDVVLCNGLTHKDIYDGLSIGDQECRKDGFKKQFDLCQSLNNDNDSACSNCRYLCRYSLVHNFENCVESKREQMFDEQTIDDLIKAHNELDDDFNVSLMMGELRKKLSPFEEVIAKF